MLKRASVAFTLLLLVPMGMVSQAKTQESPYAHVNPVIGSSGEGMTSPTAQLPFGMIQWGPDTHLGEWFNYAYEDKKILGYSMTHISGAGCRLYNDFPVLPWTGEIKENPGVAGAYMLPFSHSAEEAHPGYYALTTDDGVKTELTTTLRSGMGRFTYPAGAERTLLLEAGSGGTEVLSSAAKDVASIELRDGDTATGTIVSGHFCNGGPTYTLYFAMQFSEPFKTTGGWDTDVHPGATSATGHRAGAWVSFGKSARPLWMKLGLSFVSVENARANLKTEIPDSMDFEAQFRKVHESAEKTWSNALGKIDVSGGGDDQREVFYTGLYHMLLSPNVFNDVNGDYIDFKDKVQRLKPGETQYANYSDWDTIRNVVQLQSMLFPHESSQMMQSLVRDAEQIGVFPRWAANNHGLWVMSGDAPAIMMADGYFFGAKGFDTHTALKYMLQAATDTAHAGLERQHLDEYLSKGYVSLDDHHDVYAASASVDFNNADFAVSRMAEALGNQADAKVLLSHAQYWRNLWDKDSSLIRPREKDGTFVAGWDPEHYLPRFDRLSALGFEEGSAYQYSYMLPFNYAGLIAAMGGRDAAIPKFDKFFEKVTGWNTPNYTVTNEPDFGEEYIYDWLGQPWKSAKVISRALETFTTRPDGLAGDDDLGATSGLFVFDSLGFYPTIPGVGGFTIGTPLFAHSMMKLGNGKTIEVQTKGKGIYVQSLTVNGRQHSSTWLPLSELGNERNVLVYTLGEKPSDTWGTKPEDAPPSFDMPASAAVVPATQSAQPTKPVQGQNGQDWPWLARFKEDNLKLGPPEPGQNRVVFMGDSITEYWWAPNPPGFFPGKPYINRGISGQTTPQMLLRFRQDVIDLHPRVVVILGGINDIARNTGPMTIEQTEDNLRSMTELALANHIKVVLCSVLPAFDFAWRPGLTPAPKVDRLNAWLTKYASEKGVVYVDYHSAMKDARDGLPSNLSKDGVHPNADGYAVMAPLVEAGIQKALAKYRWLLSGT
jgi:predicted alpha-1,2-mannosidase